MAAGTATTVEAPGIYEARNGTKLLEVNFTGVQGDAIATVRAVVSQGVPMPRRGSCLAMFCRVTNNIGGGAGDSFFPVLEAEYKGQWYQIAATATVPFNTDGSISPPVIGLITTPNGNPAAFVLLLPNALLAATNLVGGLGFAAWDNLRVALNVTHAGAPAGLLNANAEIWMVPHNGTN